MGEAWPQRLLHWGAGATIFRGMSPLKKIRPKKATAAKLRNWRAWLLRQRAQPLGTSDDSLSLILRRLRPHARTTASAHAQATRISSP